MPASIQKGFLFLNANDMLVKMLQNYTLSKLTYCGCYIDDQEPSVILLIHLSNLL